MANQRASNTAMLAEGDLGNKEPPFDPITLTKNLKEVIKSITDVVTKKSQSEVIKSTVNRDMDKIENVITAIEKWYHSGGIGNSSQSRPGTRLFQPANIDSEVTRLTLRNTELSAKLKLANTQISDEQAKIASKDAEIESLKKQLSDLQSSTSNQQSSSRPEPNHIKDLNTPGHIENILLSIQQENEQIRRQIANLTVNVMESARPEVHTGVQSQGQSARGMNRPQKPVESTNTVYMPHRNMVNKNNNNNRDDETHNNAEYQQQRFNSSQRNRNNRGRGNGTENGYAHPSGPYEPYERVRSRPLRDRYFTPSYDEGHEGHLHGQEPPARTGLNPSQTYAGALRSNNSRRVSISNNRTARNSTLESRNQRNHKPLAEGALRGKPLPTDGTCLLISHVDPSKTSEEVIEIFKANIIPSVVRIQISTIIRLSAARIGIISPDKESINKLQSYIENNLQSIFHYQRIEKKRPLICFTNLPKEFTSERLLEEIKVQNEILQDIKEDDLVEAIVKRAGDNIDIVMRCEPQLYTKLIAKGYVYSQYQKIRIRNFSRFHQCYQCQEFGHTSKTCKQEQPTCGVCAGPHRSRECTLMENPICNNCKKYNLHTRNPRLKVDQKHCAYSRNCPIAKRMREITDQHTDYGL